MCTCECVHVSICVRVRIVCVRELINPKRINPNPNPVIIMIVLIGAGAAVRVCPLFNTCTHCPDRSACPQPRVTWWARLVSLTLTPAATLVQTSL